MPMRLRRGISMHDGKMDERLHGRGERGGRPHGERRTLGDALEPDCPRVRGDVPQQLHEGKDPDLLAKPLLVADESVLSGDGGCMRLAHLLKHRNVAPVEGLEHLDEPGPLCALESPEDRVKE